MIIKTWNTLISHFISIYVYITLTCKIRAPKQPWFKLLEENHGVLIASFT
jgi:hypothetical protein